MHNIGQFTGCFVSVMTRLALMFVPTFVEEEFGYQPRVSWQVRRLGFETALSGARPLLLHIRLHGPPPTSQEWLVNDAVVG